MQKLRLNRMIEQDLNQVHLSHSPPSSPLQGKTEPEEIWEPLQVLEQGEVKARKTRSQNREPQSWKVPYIMAQRVQEITGPIP